MPNIQLPRGLPRMPRFVTPRTAAPPDVVAAVVATEAEVARALVREPASAMGITLPDIPGPASILQQLIPAGGGGGSGGGGNAGAPTAPASNARTPFVYE